MPPQTHPNLLVGFDTKDDAGVTLLPGSQDIALVQTMDFFTPIVDDPYAYGAIAAANALSDIYAMGGIPMTAMNIACFDPALAAPEIWAQILKGMADKCAEANTLVVGGHSVIDAEPKFGLSVTGTVSRNQIFANSNAKPGEAIYLSKPLGTGIITTAAKKDAATNDELMAAIATMSQLNKSAMDIAHQAQVKCATDITGYGLIGHLWNVALASGVKIVLSAQNLPLLNGVEELINRGYVTGGAKRNRANLASSLKLDSHIPRWIGEIISDPQTSGGLAVTSTTDIDGSVNIGVIESGEPEILVTA